MYIALYVLLVVIFAVLFKRGLFMRYTKVMLVMLAFTIVFSGMGLYVARREYIEQSLYTKGEELNGKVSGVVEERIHSRHSRNRVRTVYKVSVQDTVYSVEEISGYIFSEGDTVEVLIWNGYACFSYDAYELAEPASGEWLVSLIFVIPSVLGFVWAFSRVLLFSRIKKVGEPSSGIFNGRKDGVGIFTIGLEKNVTVDMQFIDRRIPENTEVTLFKYDSKYYAT